MAVMIERQIKEPCSNMRCETNHQNFDERESIPSTTSDEVAVTPELEGGPPAYLEW
jgi:hypothetical protein